MMGDLVPARSIAPGRIVERELEARGWTQKDLAQIMRRPGQAINEIVRGSKQITPETAVELAAAFGTSAEFWTNLEANYRLSLAKKEQDHKSESRDITRRSALYSIAPIAELMKHGWIRGSSDVNELEREVCAFLRVDNPAAMPARLQTYKFRHTQTREPALHAQYAWLMRVRQLVEAQRIPPFRLAAAKRVVDDILLLAENARDVEDVPSVLLEAGVHLAVVPHLQKTYLDGAAFYFTDRPVIALTLRHDRLDSFWFTLMHEMAHVVLQHVKPGISEDGDVFFDDLDTVGKDESQEAIQEVEANNQASEWLLSSTAVTSFVERCGPNPSVAAIQTFARQQRRHPSIVLGRLQHREIVDYAHHRTLVTKVRPLLRTWIDSTKAEQMTGAEP